MNRYRVTLEFVAARLLTITAHVDAESAELAIATFTEECRDAYGLTPPRFSQARPASPDEQSRLAATWLRNVSRNQSQAGASSTPAHGDSQPRHRTGSPQPTVTAVASAVVCGCGCGEAIPHHGCIAFVRSTQTAYLPGHEERRRARS